MLSCVQQEGLLLTEKIDQMLGLYCVNLFNRAVCHTNIILRSMQITLIVLKPDSIFQLIKGGNLCIQGPMKTSSITRFAKFSCPEPGSLPISRNSPVANFSCFTIFLWHPALCKPVQSWLLSLTAVKISHLQTVSAFYIIALASQTLCNVMKGKHSLSSDILLCTWYVTQKERERICFTFNRAI